MLKPPASREPSTFPVRVPLPPPVYRPAAIQQKSVRREVLKVYKPFENRVQLSPAPKRVIAATGRSSVVQLSKGTPVPLEKPMRTYRGHGGEEVLLIDNGRNRISIYSDSRGREVAYLTYSVEIEKGVKIYEFGYIHVQSIMQGTKMSSLLLYHLARKALSDNAPILRVIKPDPGLMHYWHHIGFDFRKARQEQADFYSTDVSNISVVAQAEGSSGNVFRLNESIARSHWDLSGTMHASEREGYLWHKREKERLKAFNMYDGRVTPLHDYSSSYIS
ncbi:MAG: hypothetical protein WBP85_16255 [Terracidiphilus sp.]